MDKMIVYEDKNIMVIHKPAGIATQTGRLGQADLVSELKNYRKKKGEDTYIGVVHRLDQPVEGLLVFAKDAKSAKILTNQLGTKVLNKSYSAIVSVETDTELTGGKLRDYLLKDNRTNTSSVVSEEKPIPKEAKEAVLYWKIVQKCGNAALIKVKLLTGRHHQIRVQMSNAGMPLLGDIKYGSEFSKKLSKQLNIKNTALLADSIEFEHPLTGKKMSFNIDNGSMLSKIVVKI
ncbi:MAG: RluA family pseudouridine synthase [Lachnospiraceae bacterium]|nr:RluA family pseudouridine synthase [Lachnospiraceae bacterium]